eukprot:GILI01025890.1.p1 GENE.GILI01025890.1~~GILI01025890.1.p1  ORF type:complete len:175 (+),score=31.63 GILI01025890.1:55-579(+)
MKRFNYITLKGLSASGSLSQMRFAEGPKPPLVVEEGAVPKQAPASTSPSPKSYDTAALIDSLKKKDFSAAQVQAIAIAQSSWSDDYAVPLACLLILLVTFYWARSSHRSMVRTSSAQVVNHTSVIGDFQKRLDDITKTTSEGLAKRARSMDTVQQANGELTTVIDQMTAALRQC